MPRDASGLTHGVVTTSIVTSKNVKKRKSHVATAATPMLAELLADRTEVVTRNSRFDGTVPAHEALYPRTQRMADRRRRGRDEEHAAATAQRFLQTSIPADS